VAVYTNTSAYPSTYEDIFADVYVKFYSDANYSQELTLTAPLTVTVDETLHNFGTFGGDDTTTPHTITVPAGNSSWYMGKYTTEHYHEWVDPDYGTVYEVYTRYFTLPQSQY
jgi:hypothetical protein